MKFNSTVVFVTDIERSKKFYLELLNQEIDLNFGTNIVFKSGIAIWEIRDNHIISQRLDIKIKSNNFELYFETDDLDFIYNILKYNNISFLHEIHEEPWGQRTIRFFDPDNHLVEIGEPLGVFVNRMHNNGMTESQISEKTYIPISKIKELLS